MSGDRDPLTGLTDRQRLARLELMIGALFDRLAERGSLTNEDIGLIFSVGGRIKPRQHTSPGSENAG